MNYYEKHIGDYIRDTVSLTMTEDGAYGRLMDQVYQSERPLPLDKKMVYRLARATAPAERKAVDFVLEHFFRETAEGYVQKRIAAEIERYQEKQRKAKASADARWSKCKPDANASQTHDASDMRTHCEGNAHQTPDTKHQTQSLDDDDSTDSGGVLSSAEPGSIPASPAFDPPAEAPLPMREAPPISQDPAVILSVALRRQGVNCMSTHPVIQDWATKGIPLAVITEALSLARETKGNDPIHPNYLAPIVTKLLNPPAGKASSTAAPAKKDWI